MNLSSPFPNLFNTKQLSSAEVRESCLLTFKLISTPGFIGMSFYIQHERRYERNAPCVFSDSIITNTVKFTHIMGTSFTKLRLCCPWRLSYQHNFTYLLETQYAGRLKLFAEASELFTCSVFQLTFVVHKTASSHCILQEARKIEVGGC
jgi:hypothetical protein